MFNKIEKMESMAPNISVPKPTKEFHEAYEAVFGKKQPKNKDILPPIDLPPAKIQDDFGIIKEKPQDDLDLLDIPPKKPEPLPPLEDWSLAEAEKELEEIAPSQPLKKEKEKPIKKKEQKAMLHDYLSEVKFGNGASQESLPSLFDSSFEEKELAFEKETMKEGAKDLAQAFEKKSGVVSSPPSLFSDERPVLKQKIWTSSAQAKKYKKEIAAAEIKLQKQEKRLDEKKALVEDYDSKIDELKKREDAIVQKEKTAQKKLSEAKDIEHRLQVEEDSIVKKIKQLQADEKLLEKEQDAVLVSVKKFEKEKQEVERKQRAFQSLVNDISDAESLLKMKSKELDRREEQLRRREKIVQEEVAKLQKLKKTAVKLKDVEETYRSVRERLRKAYQEYEEKFTPSTVSVPVRNVQFQKSLPHKMSSFDERGDISNTLLATKQMILSKQYDDANRNITCLMNKYIQIPDTHPRKKEIYYDILSLKNMIKLDLLE